MKRILALVLFTAMLLSSAAAVAENNWMEPYPETVTVTFGRYGSESDPLFPEGESMDNSVYTKWIKDTFNIAFETAWLIPNAADHNTKLALDMVSGSLPDIFMVRDKNQLRQMIEGGMLADLTGAIENSSSDMVKEIYESYGGADKLFTANMRDEEGKIYAFPYTAPGYEFMLTWIRQDWLDKLGLATPASFAELEAAAKAFVDNKMAGDATVGVEIDSGITDGYAFLGSVGPWCHNYGAYPSNWYIDEATGKYVYGSVQPQMKDALAYMAKLYQEGVIDYEFATKDWTGSISNGNAGILFGAWWIGAWPLSNVKANDPEAEWVPLWIKSDNGEYNTYKPDIESESIYWVVSSKCEHPEVLIKMVNLAAEQQNLTGIAQYDPYPKNIPVEIDTHYSDIGYKFDFQAWPICAKVRYYDQLLRLEPVWTDLVNQVKEGKEIPKFATESFDGEKIVAYMNGEDKSGMGLHVYTKTLSLQLIAANKDSLVEKEIYVPAVTPTMEMAWSNLRDMEKQVFTKIIMGQEPLDSFDTFVKNWSAQGGDMITDEVNEAAGK